MVNRLNISVKIIKHIKCVTFFVSLLSFSFTPTAAAENLKTQTTKEYLKYIIKNNVKSEDLSFITQKELQETLRFIYRDDLTYLDIKSIQDQIASDPELTIDQMSEATRVLGDIMYVESRMNEYRFYSKFYCRFSLADNPMDEVARDSIFKRPNLYKDQLSEEEIQSIRSSIGKRAVVGLCWEHKPRNIFKYESRIYE